MKLTDEQILAVDDAEKKARQLLREMEEIYQEATLRNRQRLGQHLRALRKEAKLSVSTLSLLTGLNRGIINGVEFPTKERSFSVTRILEILDDYKRGAARAGELRASGLNLNGAERRGRKKAEVSSQLVFRVLELHRSGEPRKSIAFDLGLSYWRVTQILRANQQTTTN